MDSPIAIYSLPGTEHFYQVQGSVSMIAAENVYEKPGFVFAPFDTSDLKTYRIQGSPLKIDIKSAHEVSWKKCNRSAKSISRSAYNKMFHQGLDAIQSARVAKIVISLCETLNIRDLPVFHFLNLLRYSYPDTFVYLFYIPGEEFWIGASPELLLDTNYPFQRTTALAGTRKDAPALDDWPLKEQQEQRYVERFIEETLENYDYRKEGPTPVSAGPVQHLKSTYFVNIKNTSINPIKLHPGPALSGYPVKEAIEQILKIETHPRRYYTGFLGPVWDEGNSRFFINLRCLEILKDDLVLYAGGGLTKDSDSNAEWMEIQDKLSTLRSKLHKGQKTI